MKKICTSA